MPTDTYSVSSSTTVSTGKQMAVRSDGADYNQTVLSDAAQFSSQSRDTMRILSVTVNDFMVKHFSALPEINYIFAEQTGDVFYVRIFVNTSDDDVLDRVIDTQQMVMREFRQFAFDFSIMFQMGRNITELIAPATPLYQRL